MKSTFGLYYFLFMALILGGFASMAQNDYGMKILGISSSGFAFLFLMQSLLLLKDGSDNNRYISFLEYLSLSVLAAVFAMRSLFIHFNKIELIFSAAALLLCMVFVMRLVGNYRQHVVASKDFTWLLTTFYLSIILFLLSLAVAPLSPAVAEVLGGVSFGFLGIFGAASLARGKVILGEEKVSPILHVLKLRDSSLIILSVFVMFSLYIGLTKIDVLPGLYSSELPQGYIELIKKAENGEETAEDGKYRYQSYKERYDEFMQRNLDDQ